MTDKGTSFLGCSKLELLITIPSVPHILWPNVPLLCLPWHWFCESPAISSPTWNKSLLIPSYLSSSHNSQDHLPKTLSTTENKLSFSDWTGLHWPLRLEYSLENSLNLWGMCSERNRKPQLQQLYVFCPTRNSGKGNPDLAQWLPRHWSYFPLISSTHEV